MRRSPIALSMLLAMPASAAAQAGVRATPASAAPGTTTAAFVIRQGDDTVAIERFTRQAGRLEGDRVVRIPRTAVTHYVATLAPDGTVMRFESATRSGGELDRPAVRSATIAFAGDTSVVTARTGDSTRTTRIPARRLATPIIGFSYALYEQVVRHAVATGRDSLAVDLIFSASPDPIETWVRRIAADSAVIGFFGEPARVRIDRDGNIQELRGVQSAQQLVVTRIPTADIDSLARAFAAGDPE
jgi:hypothetical protein